MRIAVTTLGCKINQYESDLIRQDFASRGNSIVSFNGEADVYIINTCSVTAKSDMQCRQLIRAAARRGNGARIVVTGCYAETRPDEIRNIPGVDLVVRNRDKADLVKRIEGSGVEATKTDVKRALAAIKGRTRAFLKIQDGCDNRCSYCIVPSARGASRSASPGEIIAEFDRLVGEKRPEIVLTGIHVGVYGDDLPEQASLSGLLAELTARRGGTRLRLSSIEPGEVTDGIVQLLGNGLCRHLHIPLQSGDDGILKSMRRNYTAGFYHELLESIAKKVPGIALGADVMAGYPGEGEAEFQNTMDLVSASPLTHLHVFSYSPRPGTPAAEMKNQVSEPAKKERSEALRRLGAEKNLDFRKRQQGATLRVVVEDKVDAVNGLFSGLTDNYLRVHIIGAEKSHVGREISVRMREIEEEKNLATIL